MIFNHVMGTGKTTTVLNIIKRLDKKFTVILPKSIIA